MSPSVRVGAVGAAALGLAALSLLLPSAPGYDPLAWLVWGREVAALDLDTSSGPAWKPLPVAVTTVFSVAGDAGAALWLVVARAGGLIALAAGALLARRLAGNGAAAAAAASLVLVEGFGRGVALGHSEGMLVAAALLAWERHAAGRRGQAFALGVVAALLRVEVWPFLVLYGFVLWRREPRLRPWLAAAAVGVPLAWFGPELWGSGDLLRSSGRARIPNPGAPALAERPAAAVLSGFASMLPLPLLLAAAAGALLRPARLLAAVAAAWLLLVALMSEVGYSGEERYLFPAAAGAAVLAAVGVGRAAALVGSASPRLRRAAAAGAFALFAVLAALALPGARDTAANLRHAAVLHADLGRAVAAAGGAEGLLACGDVYAGRYRFPAVAWRLGVHISDVEMEPRAPGIVLRSRLTPVSAPAPDPPPAFSQLAAAGEWSVFVRCRSVA